jgi:hypothetical protein
MPLACQLAAVGLLLILAVLKARHIGVPMLTGAAAAAVILISFLLAQRVADSTGSLAVVLKTSGWQTYRNGVRVTWARRGTEAAVQLSDGRMFGPDVHSFWTMVVIVSFFATGYATLRLLLWPIKKWRPKMYNDILDLAQKRNRED